MKISVLGAGLVGSTIVKDLAESSENIICVYDRDNSSTQRIGELSNVSFSEMNLADSQCVQIAISEADLVYNCTPGFLGYSVFQQIVQAGKNAVDISFFPEDPYILHAEAVKSDACIFVDCGVAPGLSNILAAHGANSLESCKSVAVYVGGLPQNPEPPLNYRAVFSPSDVIEEYIRPASIKRNDVVQVVDALTECELLEFPEFGELEAFITDGSRSMLTEINATNIVEKTLRYPGHRDIILLLKELGFFKRKEQLTGSGAVSPFEITADLLSAHWKYTGELDVTAMLVRVEGVRAGEETIIEYRMLDRFDCSKGLSSMSRTTGYTATGIGNLIASGKFSKAGVYAPETVGKDEELFVELLKFLANRGVDVGI